MAQEASPPAILHFRKMPFRSRLRSVTDSVTLCFGKWRLQAAHPTMNSKATEILNIEGLSVVFDQGRPRHHIALKEVDLKIGAGATMGLVGESGSGKTVLAHSVLGLLPRNVQIAGGSIRFCGRELLGETESRFQTIRGKEIAMIFQDPQVSINPVFRIGTQIEWVLKLHRGLSGNAAKKEGLHLLQSVRLADPERCYDSFSHQLSGGMCQRVMIAMALACRPKLLIADEPTSALDVTTAIEILSLLSEITRTAPMALLFISHDIRAVAVICKDVSVMRAGTIVETGSAETVFNSPQQEYTKKLLSAAAYRSEIVRNTS